ncbi:MAG: glutaredoxin family protein, partial [Acidobacteriota bacterium]
IYTTKTCGYCKVTKELFQKHNIEYTEIDVGSDVEKAREMIRKSGQMGVPVILITEGDKEEMVIGYDKPKLIQLLTLNE